MSVNWNEVDIYYFFTLKADRSSANTSDVALSFIFSVLPRHVSESLHFIIIIIIVIVVMFLKHHKDVTSEVLATFELVGIGQVKQKSFELRFEN